MPHIDNSFDLGELTRSIVQVESDGSGSSRFRQMVRFWIGRKRLRFYQLPSSKHHCAFHCRRRGNPTCEGLCLGRELPTNTPEVAVQHTDDDKKRSDNKENNLDSDETSTQNSQRKIRWFSKWRAEFGSERDGGYNGATGDISRSTVKENKEDNDLDGEGNF
ncbi:hypothetical protein V6N13_108924 [Hibiscus sabdariffa]|uniref:Uncharacterized protein n=1 Tax=Hibiscus sabdariffa TaxID=183260 RepID=A0ABR2FN89_9ROSI